MQIPNIGYFKEKNFFTGNVDDTRFRVAPEDGELKAWVYHKWCFEYCLEHDEIFAQAQFPLDDDGMEQLLKWLQENCVSEKQAAKSKE